MNYVNEMANSQPFSVFLEARMSDWKSLLAYGRVLVEALEAEMAVSHRSYNTRLQTDGVPKQQLEEKSNLGSLMVLRFDYTQRAKQRDEPRKTK